MKVERIVTAAPVVGFVPGDRIVVYSVSGKRRSMCVVCVAGPTLGARELTLWERVSDAAWSVVMMFWRMF